MIYHEDTETRSKLLHEQLTERVIGAAIEVHRALGPGLLESAYEECLSHEFHLRGIPLRDKLRFLWNIRASGWTVGIASIWLLRAF
jgi:hypothetical protein